MTAAPESIGQSAIRGLGGVLWGGLLLPQNGNTGARRSAAGDEYPRH